MNDKTKPEDSNRELVTEEDLLKNLKNLEGAADDEELDEDGKPKKKKKDMEKHVETAAIGKTMVEVINEKGSEALKKALDVSVVLTEFTSLLGAHVDHSLEALEKSIAAGAQRDLRFITVLEKFQKSIEALGEKLEAFGKAPAGKPAAAVGDKDQKEVLNKNLNGSEVAGEKKLDRGLIVGALTKRGKSVV